MNMTATSEEKQSLWMLTVGPLIWALHLILSYATASIWCAKIASPGGSLTTVRILIGVYSFLALAAISMAGWDGYRRYRFGNGQRPHDADTPEDRHRFLGFAALLLSALSAVAVLFESLVIAFFGACE
jgi:hypothetical protein